MILLRAVLTLRTLSARVRWRNRTLGGDRRTGIRPPGTRTRSRRLARRCRLQVGYVSVGFRQEGILRDGHFMDGRYWDEEIYGILEDEFRTRA